MSGPVAQGAERALPRASIGTVPILWNNVDIRDLAPLKDAESLFDELARLGFEGTQSGVGFPAGDALRSALETRGLRLAEVYAALPCTPDGPTETALAVGRKRLAQLHAAGGEVLVVALEGSDGRPEASGRAADPGTPRLTDRGWAALAGSLDGLAREALELGHRTAFHGHAGTFVETPEELDRLAAATEAALVGICLDVGHYTVGGGDPVEALWRYGERVIHVHLKDVDGPVLERLRNGQVNGFTEALRERIFTELGNGILDLPGIVDALVARDYDGWLMVEQDTTWRPPSESAAIGRRVLEYELRRAASRGPTRRRTPTGRAA